MSVDPKRDRARRSLIARFRDGLTPEDDGLPHYVVCGSDPLVYTVVEELVGNGRAGRVTAIVPPRLRVDVPDPAELPGVRVVRAERLDERVFRSAGLAGAAALALVHPDDVTNIHAALCAQDVEPRLRLVLRMFNSSLGNNVKRLFPDCAVLSDAAMAAPAFVAAALGEVAPTYFRHAGRTLMVARRADVQPQHVVCPLTATPATGPAAVLPPEATAADDLVLAEASGAPAGTVVAAKRIARARRLRWPLAALARAARATLNRKLGIAVLLTLVVTVVSGAVLAGADKNVNGFWMSVYVTLLTAVGASDVEVQRHPVAQAAQLLLTISGLALLPLITAAVVDGVVKARLALAGRRDLTPRHDHVVLVGLGNVGTRVMRQLTDLGIEVVAIDKTRDARGVKVAEQHGIPLIIGDAAREETLRAASLATCQALVVVSTDDVTNLQAALTARAFRADLRVVMRLFDGDFAQRVQKAFNLGISRSVSYLAAPAFVAAMLERQVIATIPVDRHVLLVAEVTVEPGSVLAGQPLSTLARPYGVRVIGLTPAGAPMLNWSPRPQHRLAVGDRVTVVARRAGLSWLAEQAGPAAAPPTGGRAAPPIRQAAPGRAPARSVPRAKIKRPAPGRTSDPLN